MNSRKISELYESGYISGEAFLSCVESNLNTVQDVIDAGILEDPSCPYGKEFAGLLSPIDETPSQTEPEVLIKDNIDWQKSSCLDDKIEEFYNNAILELDVRTVNALMKMQRRYKDFKSYLHALIYGDWHFWKKFMTLPAVGRKTINRAREFVDSFRIKFEMMLPSWSMSESLKADVNQEEDKIKDKLDELEVLFKDYLQELTTRSYNAITNIYKNCGGSFVSFYRRITSSDFKVIEIDNVGRKSAKEITKWLNELKSEVEEYIQQGVAGEQNEIYLQLHLSLAGIDGCYTHLNREKDEVGVVNLDELEVFFKTRLQELTTRSYNAITNIYNNCGGSLTAFYKKITRPDFKVAEIENVGRKSAEEISIWLDELKAVVEEYKNNGITEEQRESYLRLHLSHIGIKGDLTQIIHMTNSLGYFPYFYAIQSFFDTLIERDRRILKYQLDFFEKKELCASKDAPTVIGLTYERIRQLRNSLIDTTRNYIKLLSQRVLDYPLPAIYYNFDEDSINNIEHTGFNGDFIRWTISILAPQDYYLIGDVEDAFVNPYGKEFPLIVVPQRLNEIFNFKGFINYLSNINKEKRVDDISIVLTEFVLSFFKGRTYYEYVDEVVDECKNIVTILFEYEILNGVIHISKNSERNNPELVEIILREMGHAMTLDEIYEEFEKRYPCRTKSATSLAGAIRTNPSIACVGRSSTYTLTEWNDGSKRGGTIREFVTEYLLTLPYPIAPLEDIGDYVRQFRPTSSDKSVHANLLLEGTFAVYYDGHVRCIGFDNYEYPDNYRKFESRVDSKRDFRTSCTLLEQFVAENSRLPFSSQVDEEEKRLCRFWNVQCQRLEKGQLSEDEEEIIIQLQQKYAGLKVSKRDYDWLQIYNEVKCHFESGCLYSSLSEENRRWLDSQLRNLRYRDVPENRINLLIELATIIADAQ